VKSAVYIFEPVGCDVWDSRSLVEPGTLVVKTSLPGCPKSGVMGHTHIARADDGSFAGLVLVNSLKRAKL
jgi:hypothetical protein